MTQPKIITLLSQKKAHSLIPSLLSILVYVFVYSQIYIWYTDSYVGSNIFDFSQALGALVLGTLSDKFCRRKTLLWSQLGGLIFLYFVYHYPSQWYFVVLLGIIYNPVPIVRAAMVDNMKNYSTIKLISLSFFVQFLPEALYSFFYKIPPATSYLMSYAALFAVFALSIFYFYDYRDAKQYHLKIYNGGFTHAFLPNLKGRGVYTFLAFLPPLLVYFLTDNVVTEYSNDPTYYSILSFGFMLGALLSLIYKKTPHVSVITVVYGICLILSLIPPSSVFIYNFSAFSIPFHFLIFGSLMGFYISFVYDTIIHSIQASYRGTTCGLLDFFCSSSYITNIQALKFLKDNLLISFGIVVLCFLVSLILQKRAE